MTHCWRTDSSRLAWTGLFSLPLLAPVSYFMLTAAGRLIFGSPNPYYGLAPGFVSHAFDWHKWHNSQLILFGPMLALVVNASVTWSCRFEWMGQGWSMQMTRRKHWLSMAIMMESALMLVLLLAYLFAKHLQAWP